MQCLRLDFQHPLVGENSYGRSSNKFKKIVDPSAILASEKLVNGRWLLFNLIFILKTK